MTCWGDLLSFSREISKGHTRKEIRCFLLDSVVLDRRSGLYHLIICKEDPHIEVCTYLKFREESDRILALKKLPQRKVKDRDGDALPKYTTKMVPLWDYVERLRYDLAVVYTYFKPVLNLKPLHIQRAKKCYIYGI